MATGVAACWAAWLRGCRFVCLSAVVAWKWRQPRAARATVLLYVRSPQTRSAICDCDNPSPCSRRASARSASVHVRASRCLAPTPRRAPAVSSGSRRPASRRTCEPEPAVFDLVAEHPEAVTSLEIRQRHRDHDGDGAPARRSHEP
jgi:hypothetical protein